MKQKQIFSVLELSVIELISFGANFLVKLKRIEFRVNSGFDSHSMKNETKENSVVSK
jgi:hypothetical protein